MCKLCRLNKQKTILFTQAEITEQNKCQLIIGLWTQSIRNGFGRGWFKLLCAQKTDK